MKNRITAVLRLLGALGECLPSLWVKTALNRIRNIVKAA